METYALFEDGSASRIVFEFFVPGPADDPVRLACIGIEDPQVVHSAQNGCLSAYHLLSRRGWINPGERFFPSCQFGEASANLRARGSSAGLAFCLKFAREVCRLRAGQAPAFAVAATGVIENGSRRAAVGRVEGLEAKVRAALGALRRGDRLFVPAANAGEITAGARRELEGKGIELIAVATVEEALLRLIPAGEDPAVAEERSGFNWRWAAVLAALAAAVLWIWERDGGGSVDELAVQCGQGQYLEARARLEEQMDEMPAAGPATQLYRQLTEPLEIRLDFHHLPASSKGLQPERVALAGHQTGAALAPADLYRFSWTVGDSCYLYAFQAGDGRLELLSPEPALLRAGRRYYLPEDTQTWFQLEEREAGSAIYLVAARMRSLDLEKLYRKYSAAAGGEREARRRELLERLTRRRQAREAGLEGIGYAELTLGAVSESQIR